MRRIKITKSITAQNVFSDAARVVDKSLSISVAGIAGGSVVWLQRKVIGGSDWVDVESYSANTEKNVVSVGAWDYRLGVKTGGFGSGTVKVVLAT